jgi:hypothetical protein
MLYRLSYALEEAEREIGASARGVNRAAGMLRWSRRLA